jgi:hypothetical protein
MPASSSRNVQCRKMPMPATDPILSDFFMAALQLWTNVDSENA